ncbi:MAG: DNA adenine methylase [Elusimicrobia bacterium]|nr:DNA adenine methylase [Elusimicrobiota bacterium]
MMEGNVQDPWWVAPASASDEELLSMRLAVRQEMERRGFRPEFIGDPLGDSADLDKGVRQAFGSYGGKRWLAHRIASYIPYHRTYAEPFAGGAAVFFAKDASPQEVLNDRDPEIAFMYRFLRDHTLEDRKALAQRDWVIRRKIHQRLLAMKPANDRDRFYKNFYLTRASYASKRGGSYQSSHEGFVIDFSIVERAQKHLQGVKVHNQDYQKVLKEYDGPETFFYLDPPYPEKFNLFDWGFKEEQFLKALEKLKARWIVSYPSERAKFFKRYHLYRVKRPNQMSSLGHNQEMMTEILVSSFPLEPVHLYLEKSFDPEEGENLVIEPWKDDLEKAP